WGFSMGTNYHFHSWRVFVIICVLPCTVSMVALRFMPESPRFLLEMGKHDEAWMILKQVHDTNMRAKGAPEKVFTVSVRHLGQQRGAPLFTVLACVLLSPDLYEHKFINCRFINTSFLEQKEGCHMDFEQDNDFLIYLVSFLGSLSVLPGNIISALLMDRVGRLKMIGGSMLISAVCCFFLFFGNSESAMIGWQCLFCGASIAAWNALDVITVELYPTNQRATAFGILNGLCKFGAILGNTIFSSFVGITKVVPILLAAASLVGGGLIALRLPETREQVLM
ncbi:synaptic vesicle glycoprotein 2B-like, partial [Leptonychotes weddellii]|uniref:Synaptic vesicle glycoprotein 2B-like n=1 Tax=Leptonychotes weddellii TaxID=9713 RepID=A0A7F8QTJ9_LEPWE